MLEDLIIICGYGAAIFGIFAIMGLLAEYHDWD